MHTRERPVARVDLVAALHRRRRTIELTGASIGAVGCVSVLFVCAFYQYFPAHALASRTAYLTLVVPLTALMVIGGWVAIRAIPTRWYPQVSLGRLVIDAAASMSATVTVPHDAKPAAVCMGVLCVIGAAVRFGLGGALATWAATYGVGMVVTAVAAFLAPEGTNDPTIAAVIIGLGYGAPISLVAGVVTGGWTRAADQHLREVEQAQAALEHQAGHDALTGLANRVSLYRRAADLHGPGALLAIDLDGFKAVNDTFGHAAGDAVLQAVAARLEDSVGADDLVVRMGGDEFVVLLVGARHAEEVAATIRTELAKPVLFGNRALSVGGSIGVAVANGSWDLDALAAAADAQMYAAKAAARRRTVLTA